MTETDEKAEKRLFLWVFRELPPFFTGACQPSAKWRAFLI